MTTPLTATIILPHAGLVIETQASGRKSRLDRLLRAFAFLLCC